MRHRRIFFAGVALIAAAVALPAPAQAQPTTPPPGMDRRGPAQGGPQRRPGPPSVDERVARMTTELGLSAEQANRLRGAFLAEQRSTDSMFARRAAARDAERAAMMATQTNMQKAIASILTPEQKLKHDAMRGRMGGAGARGRMMQRGGRMPMMEPGDGMHHDGHRAGPPQGVPPRGGPPAARPPER